eukprot:677884-Hanusia_phi.AAC.2
MEGWRRRYLICQRHTDCVLVPARDEDHFLLVEVCDAHRRARGLEAPDPQLNGGKSISAPPAPAPAPPPPPSLLIINTHTTSPSMLVLLSHLALPLTIQPLRLPLLLLSSPPSVSPAQLNCLPTPRGFHSESEQQCGPVRRQPVHAGAGGQGGREAGSREQGAGSREQEQEAGSRSREQGAGAGAEQ